ncbi:aspartate kinase [Algoriphagus halophytocola]|uniref:Aspartokinase n=1 Tax=Algoriphagus halophytocola TaxID=2991499 RepID=A0ABY6MBK0_9BACT|nr:MULTISPECIES: aspartate kinase [unclassified Algoriphagus]UZD20975.1 aspartate kinase [Algoriphagus sp. TR-M5]WBL42141.1 aspartate kinase [Algoriphagus sp. TR-M9]
MSKTLIYKFGGASVKDAAALVNLADILRNRLRNNLVIVVSAMGKSTNALEEILRMKLENKDYSINSTNLKDFHLSICRDLFPESHMIFPQIKNYFIQLNHELNKALSAVNYDEFYDRIISFGELVSSRIVMEYLCLQNLLVLWQDARELVVTNSDFRFAKVNWEETKRNCQLQLKPKLAQFPVLTQGFIGRDRQGKTTTLGREGSDFTAAILAACLQAVSVTIWKDVPGVLNADPKRFPSAQLFDELGYAQAAEMTYYGASVIHPKTIKPLANSRIPLFVRSFVDPDLPGTKIHQNAPIQNLAAIILKRDQLLLSFKVTDFTFIEERHISLIYEKLRQLKLSVNMLQTSAISISIVLDTQLFKLQQLISELKGEFEIKYNEGMELVTVLHPQKELLVDLLGEDEIFLEQTTRNTFQAVRKAKIS